MKSKKLLFSACLFFGALAVIISFSSNSTGISSVSSFGCGGSGCHLSTSVGGTLAVLNGLPTTGFIPGNTYALTLMVTNSTKVAAGFDMGISDGTLSAPPPNTTLVSATEIRHSAPQLLSSGTTSWTFNWTAPTTGPVVFFNIAANAVDLTGTEANDSWTLANAVCQVGITTSLEETAQTPVFTVYPNPVNDMLFFKSTTEFKDFNISALSINGNNSQLMYEKLSKDEYKINMQSLAKGIYVLHIRADGKIYPYSFCKN